MLELILQKNFIDGYFELLNEIAYPKKSFEERSNVPKWKHMFLQVWRMIWILTVEKKANCSTSSSQKAHLKGLSTHDPEKNQ